MFVFWGDGSQEAKSLVDSIIVRSTENFDWTLARWGVPDGPYFIIPFLGPSSVRGTMGFAADSAMKPQSYFLDWPVSVGSSLYLDFNGSQQF